MLNHYLDGVTKEKHEKPPFYEKQNRGILTARSILDCPPPQVISHTTPMNLGRVKSLNEIRGGIGSTPTIF